MSHICDTDCGENVYRRLGYAFVNSQGKICKVYSPGKALWEGTIFPELNITISEYERGLYDGK